MISFASSKPFSRWGGIAGSPLGYGVLAGIYDRAGSRGGCQWHSNRDHTLKQCAGVLAIETSDVMRLMHESIRIMNPSVARIRRVDVRRDDLGRDRKAIPSK